MRDLTPRSDGATPERVRPPAVAAPIATGVPAKRLPAYRPLPEGMQPRRHAIIDLSGADAATPRPAVVRPKPLPPRPEVAVRPEPVQPQSEAAPRPVRPAPVRRPRPAELDLRKLGPQPAEPPTISRPAAPPPTPAATPDQSAVATSPQAPPKPRFWQRELVQYPVIGAVALVAAFNSTAGQIMVALYGIVALLRHVDAKISFGIALAMLLAIPLFQAIGRAAIADNAAIYAFELLVIGTVSAAIQLRKTTTSHE